MPDDPFEGLGLDRTIIMPTPGGRVPTAPPRAPVVEHAEEPQPTVVKSGLNPLLAAANPLLDIIPQIRASIEYPNPAALRDSLVKSMRTFEARARADGATTEKIVASRYALCTSIDEAAANTPWGASGAWSQHGLLALFHNETEGGQKFFQIIDRLAENPQANLDVLELMYVCLQLGFEGRYRILEDGQRRLDEVRQRLLSIIRQQRGEYERDLAGHWRGVSAAHQTRLGWLSIWVVVAVGALLLLGLYVGFKLTLSGASDTLASEIATLRVPQRAAPRPIATPPAEARLAPFLADEVRRGLVSVKDQPDRSIVTVLGGGLFKPGDVAISPEDQQLIARIAGALAEVPGQIDVIGHTDNVPIRTLRFPSNWELSRARATSVAKLLAARVAATRITAEGRGETEPLVTDDTPQGRAQNRRVEIILHVPAGETRDKAASPGKS